MLSFHLELVLVAGLLQAGFTDRREMLQSRPLLLQHQQGGSKKIVRK